MRGPARRPAWQNPRVIPWLEPDQPFPPVERALEQPNGLLAASEDITPERLLTAYRQGIFPWYSADQPVLWWSPDPRMVLFVDEFRVARSLRKRVSRRQFEIRVDSDFRAVIDACARIRRPGQRGTWITPAVIEAYAALHERGYVHSVETWREGRLVGGLYGVAIGRVYFGESMFARETDASKVALVHLIAILRARGIAVVDCQQETAHLASFGARPIPRQAFAEHLSALVNSVAQGGPWGPVPDPDTAE
jgi:leucyl/phenylalanyl-tRNA--protein transferase